MTGNTMTMEKGKSSDCSITEMETDNRNRSFFGYTILTAKGFCMGAADVVPGVSGGTMAFILGIYEELIDAITRNIDKMMLNLRKAYEIRPKDNDRTEDELIDVMLKADQLKKEILKATSDETTDAEDIGNPAEAEGGVSQD